MRKRVRVQGGENFPYLSPTPAPSYMYTNHLHNGFGVIKHKYLGLFVNPNLVTDTRLTAF